MPSLGPQPWHSFRSSGSHAWSCWFAPRQAAGDLVLPKRWSCVFWLLWQWPGGLEQTLWPFQTEAVCARLYRKTEEIRILCRRDSGARKFIRSLAAERMKHKPQRSYVITNTVFVKIAWKSHKWTAAANSKRHSPWLEELDFQRTTGQQSERPIRNNKWQNTPTSSKGPTHGGKRTHCPSTTNATKENWQELQHSGLVDELQLFKIKLLCIKWHYKDGEMTTHRWRKYLQAINLIRA